LPSPTKDSPTHNLVIFAMLVFPYEEKIEKFELISSFYSLPIKSGDFYFEDLFKKSSKNTVNTVATVISAIVPGFTPLDLSS